MGSGIDPRARCFKVGAAKPWFAAMPSFATKVKPARWKEFSQTVKDVRIAVASPARMRAAQVALVVLGSLLMALGAHVAIPVPFSPVPITGQTFALAMVVALLGTRGATVAMLLYIAEGFTGLPVFAPLGKLGPTAGYIFAFPLAAFVTGWLFDRGWYGRYLTRTLAILVGTIVVFVGGSSWLAALVGWPVALATGVVPFLLGDAIKTLVAAATAPYVRDAGKNVPQL